MSDLAKPPHGRDVRPTKVAPSLHQSPDAVNVPALGLLLLGGVEQSWRDLLLRGRDGKNVTAAPPARVDDVGDLVVRVEAEMSSRLAIRGVQDRIFDDNLGHRAIMDGVSAKVGWP